MLEKGNTIFYIEYQRMLYGHRVLDHIVQCINDVLKMV